MGGEGLEGVQAGAGWAHVSSCEPSGSKRPLAAPSALRMRPCPADHPPADPLLPLTSPNFPRLPPGSCPNPDPAGACRPLGMGGCTRQTLRTFQNCLLVSVTAGFPRRAASCRIWRGPAGLRLPLARLSFRAPSDKGGTPRGGFRMAWRGRPTSSWETLEAPTWWGSVRVQGEAGGVLGTLAFLPAGIGCLPKGAEAARRTPGSGSGLLCPPPWPPLLPQGLCTCCALPGALSLGPGLSLPPCPLVGSTSAGLLGGLAPSVLSAPSPPLLSAGQEAAGGLVRLCCPWDPE